MKRVTPARPINLDRVTIRRERILATGGAVWVLYSPQRPPTYRAAEVLIDGVPMYRTWFYRWQLLIDRLDSWAWQWRTEDVG